ncbi:MAG: ABC transporter permease [Planctomycetaceae bacterium]|nr:ABC transporter permease [Planctomycetaceae bacterium]
MFEDIRNIIKKWRAIHLIGISALRARYARSVFGQLWLTITAFINIAVIGIAWALLWHRPLDAFLPYYGVGQILFALLSSTVNESTRCLSADSKYYLTDKTPFMLSVFAIIYRNILLFLHQLPIIVGLVIWSKSAQFDASPLFPLAIVVTLILCLFTSYTVAVVCARFRDLQQIVQLVMQNLFLLSPIIWQVDIVPEKYRWFLYFNPITCVLETIRNPVVGLPASWIAYIWLLFWTTTAGLCAKITYARWNRVIIFWI